MFTRPAIEYAGEVATICVLFTIENVVASVLPNFTEITSVKSMPVKVTNVPPDREPLVGTTLYITGIFGFSGTSGFSGISGLSGYSGLGISGYSGQSGTSGYSGFSGFSGISGFSGESGTSGYSGSGISGYSGFSGAQGTSINIIGTVPTPEDLLPTGELNDA